MHGWGAGKKENNILFSQQRNHHIHFLPLEERYYRIKGQPVRSTYHVKLPHLIGLEKRINGIVDKMNAADHESLMLNLPDISLLCAADFGLVKRADPKNSDHLNQTYTSEMFFLHSQASRYNRKKFCEDREWLFRDAEGMLKSWIRELLANPVRLQKLEKAGVDTSQPLLLTLKLSSKQTWNLKRNLYIEFKDNNQGRSPGQPEPHSKTLEGTLWAWAEYQRRRYRQMHEHIKPFNLGKAAEKAILHDWQAATLLRLEKEGRISSEKMASLMEVIEKPKLNKKIPLPAWQIEKLLKIPGFDLEHATIHKEKRNAAPKKSHFAECISTHVKKRGTLDFDADFAKAAEKFKVIVKL